jgi:hypothetical protein
MMMMLLLLLPPWCHSWYCLFIICSADSSSRAVEQMQQQHAAAFPLAALPIDTVAHVLRWVPQQQRLCQCAMVCRAWRTAAAAATVDIQTVPASNLKAAQCFHKWLLRHGGSVQALTLNRTGTSQRSQQIALPLKQLHGVSFVWATNADILDDEEDDSLISDNPLAALTGLETLGLSRSSVCGEPGGLRFLPVLGSSLRRLRLAYVSSRYDMMYVSVVDCCVTCYALQLGRLPGMCLVY